MAICGSRSTIIPFATMGAGKRASARRAATRDKRLAGVTDETQVGACVAQADHDFSADAAVQAEAEQRRLPRT
jgi:hypothetical protein